MVGAPAYDAAHLDGDSVEELMFVLAERYGVSESFLRVRLERYDLMRTGWFAQYGSAHHGIWSMGQKRA